MSEVLIVALAALWVWESVRYAASQYAPGIFSATRVLHPLVAAALPVALFWPDWVEGLAAAGLVGLMSLIVRALTPDPVPTYVPRTTRSGLPPLPG